MAQSALKNESTNISEFKTSEKESKQLTHDVEQLRQDLTILKNDITSIAKTLSELSLNQINATKDSVLNGSKEMYQSASDLTNETIKSTEKQIQDRPFLAIAAAFGLGALISKLSGR